MSENKNPNERTPGSADALAAVGVGLMGAGCLAWLIPIFLFFLVIFALAIGPVGWIIVGIIGVVGFVKMLDRKTEVPKEES